MEIVFEPAEKANRRAVLESISDTEAHCIWDTLEDLDQSDDELTIQEEADVPKFINWVDFLQSVDEDLMEDQMKCIVQLFQVTLHNVGAPSTGVTSTGRAWSDTESEDVSASPTKLMSSWPMYQLSILEKFMPKFPSPTEKPSRDK